MTLSTVSVDFLLERKGRQVWSVSPFDSVYDAIHLMADKGVGAVVVLDDFRLVGILSERDYTRKVILQGKHSKETKVAEIMTPNVVTAHPADTVRDCMKVMTERRVRHLPVLSNQMVVGVLSIGDLVKWTLAEQEETINRLHHYIAGSYPS
jgi:CBS domain-containing protein